MAFGNAGQSTSGFYFGGGLHEERLKQTQMILCSQSTLDQLMFLKKRVTSVVSTVKPLDKCPLTEAAALSWFT